LKYFKCPNNFLCCKTWRISSTSRKLFPSLVSKKIKTLSINTLRTMLKDFFYIFEENFLCRLDDKILSFKSFQLTHNKFFSRGFALINVCGWLCNLFTFIDKFKKMWSSRDGWEKSFLVAIVVAVKIFRCQRKLNQLILIL
jgi:hypothetical protein